MNSEVAVNRKIHGHNLYRLWRKLTSFRETTVILIIALIFAVLSVLSPYFFTKENLMSMAIGLSVDGIITVGMTIALVSGGLDLSAGSVMSLCGVTTGALYLHGINIWVAALIAILIGILCGLMNGFFIGKVGINPFITTLAIMGIAKGVSFAITRGSPISLLGVPEAFSFIGQGEIFGVPFIVLAFLLIIIIGDFMMRRSEILRKVFYTGSNEKTAVLSGIDICKVKLGVYLSVSTLAGIAGIFSVARFGVATPISGMGVDISMRCILAAVIGGASLSGGEGTVLGSVLGLIFLNIIENGLIILNVPVYWQDLLNGVILICAVTLDYLSHRSRIKKL